MTSLQDYLLQITDSQPVIAFDPLDVHSFSLHHYPLEGDCRHFHVTERLPLHLRMDATYIDFEGDVFGRQSPFPNDVFSEKPALKGENG